jgi:DUF1680 family protein
MGSFAGWASANEWFDDEMRRKGRGGIMHCCTGNAAQTVFYLWKQMLEYSEGELRVNLLLNRASPWADLYSHIPYEGRLDVKMKKQARKVLVRAPEWVNQPSLSKMTCTVNGTTRDCQLRGRYLDAGAARPGDDIVLRFPISERTVSNQKIGNRTYALVVKGNTVISVDPAGEQCPMYARSQYRGSAAPRRTVRRFLAGDEIAW